MTDLEVLHKMIDTNWVDRDRAYALFMSYTRNRKDLSQEQILRVVECLVAQTLEVQ